MRLPNLSPQGCLVAVITLVVALSIALYSRQAHGTDEEMIPVPKSQIEAIVKQYATMKAIIQQQDEDIDELSAMVLKLRKDNCV